MSKPDKKAPSLMDLIGDLGKIEERTLAAMLTSGMPSLRDSFLKSAFRDPHTVTGRIAHTMPEPYPYPPRLMDDYRVTYMQRKSHLLDDRKLAKLVGDIRPDMMMRQRLMHDRMLESYMYKDTRGFEEIAIGDHLLRARQVIGQTLYECQNPNPDTPSGKVESRLARTLRLIWYHETLDDMAHDLGLEPRDQSIRDLERKWNDGTPYRGYERNKADAVATFCRRFVDEMNRMRTLTTELEQEFETPRSAMHEYDTNFYELVITACFGAALGLEANFEERFYADEPAPSA